MSKEKFTQKHQKLIGVISIVVFILFTALVCWYIGKPMLDLASKPELFRDWIDSKGILGRFIFVGMVALQVIVAIIPGEPLEIGAGYAFGAIEGTILCILGGLIGGLVVFAFVRSFGIKVVEIFFPVDRINNLKLLSNQKRFYALVFLIFLIPGTPKDMLLYFLGVTKISLPFFILTITLARVPSIVTSTIGGNALGLQNYISAIVVFAVTLILSCVGYFIYKRVSDNRSDKE